MDTLVFGLLLAAALVIVFSRRKWVMVTGWSVASLAALLLFLHHVTSTLPLSF